VTDLAFYPGDPWYVEAVTVSPKTGLPVEPGSVSATIYGPTEWDQIKDVPIGAGKGPVALAKLEANKYEGLAVAVLPEPGIWRAIINTTAPFVGVQPVLITVQPVGAL
jgi:hypothetical protein